MALRASSMLMHLEAIRAGTGRGVLPCYVGDGHPVLERLTPPVSELAAEYWIIVPIAAPVAVTDPPAEHDDADPDASAAGS